MLQAIYGANGRYLMEALEKYDYSTMFSDVVAVLSVDCVGASNGAVWPLLYHYGDIAGANVANDRCTLHAQPLLGGPFAIPDEAANTVGNAMLMWPNSLFELGRFDDAKKLMLMMQWRSSSWPNQRRPVYSESCRMTASA